MIKLEEIDFKREDLLLVYMNYGWYRENAFKVFIARVRQYSSAPTVVNGLARCCVRAVWDGMDTPNLDYNRADKIGHKIWDSRDDKDAEGGKDYFKADYGNRWYFRIKRIQDLSNADESVLNGMLEYMDYVVDPYLEN